MNERRRRRDLSLGVHTNATSIRLDPVSPPLKPPVTPTQGRSREVGRDVRKALAMAAPLNRGGKPRSGTPTGSEGRGPRSRLPHPECWSRHLSLAVADRMIDRGSRRAVGYIRVAAGGACALTRAQSLAGGPSCGAAASGPVADNPGADADPNLLKRDRSIPT